MEVLRLRLSGVSQEEIASRFGTTRQNISMIERRGRRNLRLAEETIRVYKKIITATSVKVEENTHLVDIPRLVLDAADKAGVKLRADFTRIYKEIRFKVPGCMSGVKVIKPITILILKDGDIEVVPAENGDLDENRTSPQPARRKHEPFQPS